MPRARPASVERVVRLYLGPDVPDVQIGDALELVQHYEVSGLATPLRAWYLDQQASGQLRPDVALQVLDALVQVAPPELRPWVDAEARQWIDRELRGLFLVGGLVSPRWDALLLDLGDLALLDQLRAEAAAAATPARQAALDPVGRDWRKLGDWARLDSAFTRSELAKRVEAAALPAEQRAPSLVVAYADSDAYQRPLRVWAARELRHLAQADPAQLTTPTARDDTARARAYDAIRVFGGAPNEDELSAEAALQPAWQWFELSHRAG